MTGMAVGIATVCQLVNVVGQLLLKQAMGRTLRIGKLALGIAVMAVWFFLWIGLMGHWALSQIYAFEGLGPVLMVIAARIFLKEKLPAEAWMGIALVAVGVAVVGGS